MEINLNDFEEFNLNYYAAYAKGAELLGLDTSLEGLEKRVVDYINEHHQWYSDDEEYEYRGYDCGDCYSGGDVKKGIVIGDTLVVLAKSPGYNKIRIFKKKA